MCRKKWERVRLFVPLILWGVAGCGGGSAGPCDCADAYDIARSNAREAYNSCFAGANDPVTCSQNRDLAFSLAESAYSQCIAQVQCADSERHQ